MRPTRRNDASPPAIRAAPSISFRKRLKTGILAAADASNRTPATTETVAWRQARHPAACVAVEDHTRNIRLRRAAEHLHLLGPRPVLEALIEVANGHDLDRVLASFARLDPDIISALAGDRMPPTPIHRVTP